MKKKTALFRVAVIALLLTALIFSGSASLNSRLEQAGVNRLYETNQAYIEKSLHRALTTFAVLSGIKIGLAIMEGSELGVGFGIEVGDAVQSAYDYVDVAWRTVLALKRLACNHPALLGLTILLLPLYLAGVACWTKGAWQGRHENAWKRA